MLFKYGFKEIALLILKMLTENLPLLRDFWMFSSVHPSLLEK